MSDEKPAIEASEVTSAADAAAGEDPNSTPSTRRGETMEIHAPEKPIHSKKEFLFHMFTVVLGILIALGLEGMVQWAHHRALVREARENIRVEIEKNKETIDGAMPEFKQRNETLNHMIDSIRELAKTHHAVKGEQNFFSISNHDLYSTAWQTASTSGAVTYMSYDELRRYTDVYLTQQTYSTLQAQALDRAIDLGSLVQATILVDDVKNIPKERIQAIAREAYRQMILQNTLEDVSKELSKGYGDLLKHR